MGKIVQHLNTTIMTDKHILVQGGMLYCSQSVANNSDATAVPIMVSSQTLAEANGSKRIATHQDNAAPNMNFGLCNDPKYRSPVPCVAQVRWTKCCEGVSIGPAALLPLLEDSLGICSSCSIPGQITVAFHGQQATLIAEVMAEVDSQIMEQINPLTPALPIDEELIIESKGEHFYYASIDQINAAR